MGKGSKPQKREEGGGEGRTGGRGKRRPLRGSTLVSAAIAVLSQWATMSPKANPINISKLARELGVTRQAIYSNGLAGTVDEYRSLQQKNFSTKGEASSRRPLEERVARMDEELRALREKLDGWIERWAAVEYNARMFGLDPDKIFAPIPPPDRMLTSVGSRKRGGGSNE